MRGFCGIIRWTAAVVTLLAVVAMPRSLDAAGGVITTVAGGGVGDGGPPTSAPIYRPRAVAIDGAGDLYIADWETCRIRRVSSGIITTVAGNGTCGYGGDGGAATNASLNDPYGVAADAAGNLYIADHWNCRVRKVSAGIMTTVVGTGGCGYGGDGGPAPSATLSYLEGVALDGGGALYIADASNCRVRKVSGGIITTVAGTGTCGNSGDGGLATNALINPESVMVDGVGDLYIGGGCRVRRVSDEIISTVAGNGICGTSGDGGAATNANVYAAGGLAKDASGNLYIADWWSCRVRVVSGGIIMTVAGKGVWPTQCGYSGDGGAAVDAQLHWPYGVAVDSAGDLYIADDVNCRVRRVSGGTIVTAVGNGTCGHFGDGGAAIDASLRQPSGVSVDGEGNLYIADRSNCRVRKVSSGVITTVAGDGTCGFGGDGDAATNAKLNYATSVAVDGSGNLYIGDWLNCRVRKVSGGIITTVAGNGICTYSGDWGWATNAGLHYVQSIAVDATGSIYIAESYGCRIRKVSSGIITTIAGNGTCGYGGDGGNATSASLWERLDVAADAAGNLYIADYYNCRVRKVSGGIITTVVGNGLCEYTGDGAATSVGLHHPYAVAVDDSGNLHVADLTCRLRKVSGGILRTAAGNGTCGYSGDGGAAISASLRIASLAVDGNGNVFISDSERDVVRQVSVVAGVGGVARSPDLPPKHARSAPPASMVMRGAFGALAAFVLAAGAWVVSRNRRTV